MQHKVEDALEILMQSRVEHLWEILIELKTPVSKLADCLRNALKEFFFFSCIQYIVIFCVLVCKLHMELVKDLQELELSD